MNNKTVKWGILGPGKIAAKFALGLKEVKNAELYAIASRTLTRAEDFAKEWNATKFFGSYKEMLKDEELDVVYVATPHVFHFEHTILCLRNKKAVLCEKPFALNKNQVEEMIATAKKENTFLMEAMWTQFLPHFHYVMDLIQSQKYGKIKSLKADFGFRADFDPRGRLFDIKLGGGSLLDIGIYPIFFALSSLGKPEKITAEAFLGKTNIDEKCNMIFHYPEGVKAEVRSSIIEDTPTTAEIVFENAILKINPRFHTPTSVTISTKNGEETKEFGVTSNGYNFEAEHVQEMLQKGRIESDQMTFSKSMDLIELLDEVRALIGLEY